MTLEIEKRALPTSESSNPASSLLTQASLGRCSPHSARSIRPQHPYHYQQHQQQLPLHLHLKRTVRTVLMPTAIDSLPLVNNNSNINSRRNSNRRKPYSGREHAVIDPGAGGWGGQRLAGGSGGPEGSGGSTGGPGGQQPMATSGLPPDEVHTFPGLCENHPPDDLSTIALAPLSEYGGGALQGEQMQTDDVFRPEVSSMAGPPGAFAIFPTSTAISGATASHSQPMPSAPMDTDIFTHHTSGFLPEVMGTAPIGGALKQEVPSPTDYAQPGPSSGFLPGSTTATPQPSSSTWMSASTPSPGEPVIPLTALELITQDSSDSSSDGESSQTKAQKTDSASSGKSTSKSSSAGGAKSRQSSTSDKTLDRRKATSAQSDADSSDDSADEYGASGQELGPDDKDRLDRRRLSNRVAAQKCRQRQRQHYRGLMKEIQDWECKNTGVTYEVRQLQKTLRQLLQEVEDHEAHCTTGTSALPPGAKEEYQKTLDDVTSLLSETASKKGGGK